MTACDLCGKSLLPIEISFSLKLFGRGSERRLCKSCIGKEFSLDEETLDALAERWKSEGCALFT